MVRVIFADLELVELERICFRDNFFVLRMDFLHLITVLYRSPRIIEHCRKNVLDSKIKLNPTVRRIIHQQYLAIYLLASANSVTNRCAALQKAPSFRDA